MQEQHDGAMWRTLARVMGLLLCFFFLTGCEEKPRMLSFQEEDFLFQPQISMTAETVLQSLQPSKGRPPETRKPHSQPIVWRQGQFSAVVKKLIADEIEQVARMTLVGFSAACRDTDFGPQAMQFFFHRIGRYEGQQARFNTTSVVDAQNGFLGIIRTVYIPPAEPQSTIDDLEAKIPAEKILSLAETMEGKKYRELLSNECSIEGNLVGNRWQIIYASSVKATARLSLVFDATTGDLLGTLSPPSTVGPQK